MAAAAYSAAERAGRPFGTTATLLSDRPVFFSPDDASLVGKSIRISTSPRVICGVGFSMVAFENLLLLLLTLSSGAVALTERADSGSGSGVNPCSCTCTCTVG